VNIVVNSSVILESGWLPELLLVVSFVVHIKGKLREVANQEESEEVSFKACIEALEVGAVFGVALISENLLRGIRDKRGLPSPGNRECRCMGIAH
jgi:hypothetical protein